MCHACDPYPYCKTIQTAHVFYVSVFLLHSLLIVYDHHSKDSHKKKMLTSSAYDTGLLGYIFFGLEWFFFLGCHLKSIAFLLQRVEILSDHLVF